MERFVFALIYLLTFLSTVSSQDNLIEERGDDYVDQMFHFYDLNNLDSALVCAHKALGYYKNSNTLKYLASLNDIAYIYYRQNSLLAFKNALDLAIEAAQNNKIDSLDTEYIRAEEQLHTYYYYLGNYEKSLETLERTFAKKLINNIDTSDLVNSYINFGTVYNNLGDYENALLSFNKASQLVDTNKANSLNSIGIYINIGHVYESIFQLDTAIIYYQKAVDLAGILSSSHYLYFKKIESHIFLAKALVENNNLEQAKAQLEIIDALEKTKYWNVYYHEINANYFSKRNNLSKAIDEIKLAQKMSEKSNLRANIPIVVKRLVALASYYKDQGNLELEEDVLDQALKVLIPKSIAFANAESIDLNFLLDKIDALKVIHAKAVNLVSRYYKSNDVAYLKTAFDTYLKSNELITSLRKNIYSTASKKILAEQSMKIYSGGIELAFDLYQLTGSDYYLDQAFIIAESNKSRLLLENVTDQTAKNYTDIPKSVLDRERDLKIQMVFYKNKQLEEKLSKNEEDNLFQINQEINLLQSEIERNYPKYKKRKFDIESIGVSQIQEIINPHHAVIEFYVSSNSIYLIGVSKSKKIFLKIEEKETVFEKLNLIESELSIPPENKNPKVAFDNFSQLSYDLYKYLLDEALKKLGSDIEKLSIVPDDLLNYLPFSILIENEPNLENPGFGLSNLDYLIKKYSINYQYSASIFELNNASGDNNFEFDFLGYSPTFSNNGSSLLTCKGNELGRLFCNQEEVEQIGLSYNSTIRNGKEAFVSRFTEEADSYRIIHLATHACVDQNNPDQNKIFFDDGYLSMHDIYNTQLDAELVVLSACNTGVGELAKGEGVMSLTKGFISSGCKSTLMSMWTVDDCVTSELMQLFYTHLQKGEGKASALRLAKLNYLESASKVKLHPFYWSAFVHNGNMDIIGRDSIDYFLFLILLAAFIITIRFFWAKKFAP